MEERKLEKIIDRLHLERPIASLPRRFRFAVARRRYGWIDGLANLRHSPNGPHSLAESEKLNAIFIHVPKSAGVSVAKTLFGNHAASHTPLYMYLALYGARDFDRMYKFSFVRHPFDRLASAFSFLQKGGMTQTDQTWAENNLPGVQSLDEFILTKLSRPEIFNWTHFRPQVFYLKDPRTKKVGVDFLGRFENIKNDFEIIQKELGVETPLLHTNKSSRSSISVSAEAQAVVKELYAEDFRSLGYD